jgi:hypothetical protein
LDLTPCFQQTTVYTCQRGNECLHVLDRTRWRDVATAALPSRPEYGRLSHCRRPVVDVIVVSDRGASRRDVDIARCRWYRRYLRLGIIELLRGGRSIGGNDIQTSRVRWDSVSCGMRLLAFRRRGRSPNENVFPYIFSEDFLYTAHQPLSVPTNSSLSFYPC